MIEQMTVQEGVQSALTSLLNNRLTLLAGAGLSMAPPTGLKSAAQIAAHAKQKYDAMYGATRPPLSANIEDQAQFFFENGELATVYFRNLIDKNAFAGRPNSGHYAIADLLLVQSIDVAITTNVDALIELAGSMIFGQIGAGIDRDSVVSLPANTAPLLKIHGCRNITPDDMVWAPGQLAVAPVAARIASSAQWLNVRLLDRDLVIVGYWTDWDYLNAVLQDTLGAVNPSRVIIVDPAAESTFEAKAPTLYALGERASVFFRHVRASGADFLAELRREFSKSYIRQVLHGGVADFVGLTGNQPDAGWAEPPDLDNEALWQLRRDLEGRIPNEPAKNRSPPAEPLIGLTILQLRAKGAVAYGDQWILGNRRIRVLRAANKLLYRVEAEYERESAPTVSADVVIAVGAESHSLPSNIARAGTQPTIARGTSSRWMTRSEAAQEFAL